MLDKGGSQVIHDIDVFTFDKKKVRLLSLEAPCSIMTCICITSWDRRSFLLC